MVDNPETRLATLEVEMREVRKDIEEIKNMLTSMNGELNLLNTAFNMGKGGAIVAAKFGGLLLLALGALAWVFDRIPLWIK